MITSDRFERRKTRNSVTFDIVVTERKDVLVFSNERSRSTKERGIVEGVRGPEGEQGVDVNETTECGQRTGCIRKVKY